MQQLVCWTLANLYSIALVNRPTAADTAKFNLAGWDSDHWFTIPDNRARWYSWVNATWGPDLGAHFGDAWVVPESTEADADGRTEAIAFGTVEGSLLGFSLWRICRREFSKAGNFIAAILGDFCSSVYPPDPTPTPTPAPTPTPEPEPPIGKQFVADKTWGETTVAVVSEETGLTRVLKSPFSYDHSTGKYPGGPTNWTATNLKETEGESPKSFVDFVILASAHYLDDAQPWCGTGSPAKYFDIVFSSSDLEENRLEKVERYSKVVSSFNYELKGGYTMLKGQSNATGVENSNVKICLLVPNWFLDNTDFWQIKVRCHRSGVERLCTEIYYTEVVEIMTLGTTAQSDGYYKEGTWLTEINGVTVSSMSRNPEERQNPDYMYEFNRTLEYKNISGISGTLRGITGTVPEEYRDGWYIWQGSSTEYSYSQQIWWPLYKEHEIPTAKMLPVSSQLSEDGGTLSFRVGHYVYAATNDSALVDFTADQLGIDFDSYFYYNASNAQLEFSFSIDPAGEYADYTFAEELRDMASTKWCEQSGNTLVCSNGVDGRVAHALEEEGSSYYHYRFFLCGYYRTGDSVGGSYNEQIFFMPVGIPLVKKASNKR